MTNRLYQKIADTVRAHSGTEALIEDIWSRVSDDAEGTVSHRVDELRNQDPAVDAPPGYTEIEAAQRWCPFTREVTPVGNGKKDVAIGNRFLTARDDYTNPAGCRCVASHCMAWRWTSVDRGGCGLAGPFVLMPAGEPRRLPNRVPPARETIPDLFDDVVVADGCGGGTGSTT
jgi:hypothetical protein